MDLNKHLEYFNPITITDPINIIGVGAMGHWIAVMLVRLGVQEITIWDFDTVTPHNLTNQHYNFNDIGKSKTESIANTLRAINPNVKVNTKGRYTKQPLAGYIFLSVDSIETRRKIVEEHYANKHIKAMFDTRMGLESAQAYGAVWTDEAGKLAFLNSMKFTDAEADKSVPVSACGTALSVIPTVVTAVSVVIADFINLINGHEVKTMQFVNPFAGSIITY